ncbi:response regulator [bacterium]|nr:response regulator [bacterium]
MTSKILIITDGKKSSIDSIYQYLTEHGYEVLVAYDAINGFNAARNKKPDLILINAVLSGSNGYQICSLLKFDIKYEDIVVVILSDGDGPKYRQLADNSGADGILVKPIDINELMGIVRSVNLKV